MSTKIFTRHLLIHLGLLSLIAVAALGLRAIHLSDNPAGFFRDEADKGYTAYSLWNTGMDQSGEAWPLFVRSLHVTTSGLYQYLDIPFIALFGLNEWAVRLPACLAGALSVLAAWALARHWWGASWGLWAALFVCLSPWSLLLSRWANQSILLTLWIPLGIYYWTIDHKKASYKNLLLAAAFFLLALYTYAPARLIVPVLVFGLMLLRWFETESQKQTACLRRLAVMAGLCLLGSIPLIHHLLFEPAESTSRLSQITIFDGQPLPSLIGEWLWNYTIHLSPNFLFALGDQNMRHNSAVFGQEHWFLLPLLVGGLVRAVQGRQHSDRILLLWFFLFPIAAACTRESLPHALRSVFAVPVLQLLCVRGLMAFGLWMTALRKQGRERLVKILIGGWLAGLIMLPAIHLYDLFYRYPLYSAIHWQYGYREAVEWWKENRTQNHHTVITGLAEYPETFFLFYMPFEPEKWIAEQSIPNVTFAPRGHPINNYLPENKTSILCLVRPSELPNRMPQKSIQAPSGDFLWKWVVLREDEAE